MLRASYHQRYKIASTPWVFLELWNLCESIRELLEQLAGYFFLVFSHFSSFSVSFSKQHSLFWTHTHTHTHLQSHQSLLLKTFAELARFWCTHFLGTSAVLLVLWSCMQHDLHIFSLWGRRALATCTLYNSTKYIVLVQTPQLIHTDTGWLVKQQKCPVRSDCSK